MTRTPRPYQRTAIAAIYAAYRAGKRRILVVSPTGSGKTYIGTRLCADFAKKCQSEAWGWHAHRRELVSQAAESLEEEGLQPGYQGLRASALGQIASVGSSLSREEVPPGRLQIFDEGHHFAAPTWNSLVGAYAKEDLLVFLTATPERGDGRALDFCDHIVEVATSAELVEWWRRTEGREGLVPCEVLRPPKPQRAGFIAREPVDAYREAGLQGRSAVVFAPRVEEAERFAADFVAHGIKAHAIHQGLDDAERDRRLAEFAAGKVKVLCNVFILTEGWDCPRTSVIILARRFQSIGAMIQCVGRGRRPFEGKDLCTILDLTGCTHILGDPDEERVYSLDGVGITRKAVSGPCYCSCGKIIPTGETSCSNCGRPKDEAEPLKTSNDPLERFARYQRDSDETRAARLAKFMKQAIERGSKKQSAFYRYKGMYFVMPQPRIISQAEAILAGNAWCSSCGHGVRGGKCRCVRAA
jgi:superfamily II DNA or RNA helicase